MTQLEKIEEILREYENGSDVSAEDVLEGIKNVLEDTETYRQQVSVDTPAGKLCAYIDPNEDHPGVVLCMIPEGWNYELDICVAECKGEELLKEGENPKDVSVYNWTDVTSEEWQTKFILKREDIVQYKNDIDINSEIKRIYTEIRQEYLPENIDEIADLDFPKMVMWLNSDIRGLLLDGTVEDTKVFLDMIQTSPCAETILSEYVHFDSIEEDVKIRRDFKTALENVENGSDLSLPLGFGFMNEDIKNLAQLHRDGSDEIKEKIEDLLEDCNFHRECEDFANGNYSQYILSEIKGREDTSEKQEPEL